MKAQAERTGRSGGRAIVHYVVLAGFVVFVAAIAGPAAAAGPRIDCVIPADRQPFADDPAVIWYDNFDGPDAVQKKYMEPEPGSADDRRTDKQALGGAGKSMECFYAKGKQGAGNRKIVFGDSPVGYPLRPKESFDEVYWRVYVKHQPGWTGDPAKLSRATSLVSPNWRQAFILHVWGDGPSLTLDPATGVRGGEVVTTRYNDFGKLKWLGNKPAGKFPIHSTDEAGRWVCVEAHLKLNTPGKKDGTAHLWVDGRPDGERTGMDFRGTYAAKGINAVFLEAYWNDGSPVDQSRWYDDFVVSTKPIGPVVTPARPTLIKAAVGDKAGTSKAWEVEVAADADGKSVLWRSKASAAERADVRLTVSAETGTFAGPAADKAALPAGATCFCRCREQDAGGQWSEWSPWHQPFVVEKTGK